MTVCPCRSVDVLRAHPKVAAASGVFAVSCDLQRWPTTLTQPRWTHRATPAPVPSPSVSKRGGRRLSGLGSDNESAAAQADRRTAGSAAAERRRKQDSGVVPSFCCVGFLFPTTCVAMKDERREHDLDSSAFLSKTSPNPQSSTLTLTPSAKNTLVL